MRFFRLVVVTVLLVIPSTFATQDVFGQAEVPATASRLGQRPPWRNSRPAVRRGLGAQSGVPSAVSTEAAAPTPGFGGFYSAPYFATSTDTFETLTGDFNHDGKPDLVTIHSLAAGFDVLLNDGEGGFKAAVSTNAPYSMNYSSLNISSAAAADLNGDGYTDIVIGLDGQLDGESSQYIPLLFIFLNKKNGTFAAPVLLYPSSPTYNSQSESMSMNFGVVQTTSSGHEDIVVVQESRIPGSTTYSTEIAVQTLLNNGSGSFTGKSLQVIPASLQTSAGGPLTPLLSDVNGDGKADLVLERDPGEGDDENDYIYFMAGNGDGTFQLPSANYTVKISNTELGSTRPAYSVLLSSVTSDSSKKDLLVNTYGGIYEALSNGDGTFQTPKLVATSSVGEVQLVLADLNADGKNDLVTVGPGVFATYLGNGDGTFGGLKSAGTASLSQGEQSTFNFVVADFNSDGKPDFANGSFYGEIEVGKGVGDGTFEVTPVLYSTKSPAVSPTDFGVLVAPDLNGDGIPDLLGFTDGPLTSAVANGKGGFTYQTALAGGSYPPSYINSSVGDFNGDGKQDIVMATYVGGEGVVAVSKGDGTLKTPVTMIKPPLTLACALGQSAVGDINGDGKLDVIFAYRGDNSCDGGTAVGGGFLFALGNGDGTFKAATYSAAGTAVYSIALGHFHGSSKPLDVVAALGTTNLSADNLTLFEGKGDGTFDAGITLSDKYLVYQVLTDDFNQDGKADITISALASGSPFIDGPFLLPGNGDGTFGSAMALNPQSSYTAGNSSAVYADLNGDGVPDLIRSSEGFLQVFLGQGQGSFAAPIYAFVQTGPTPIAAGRYTGDNSVSLAAISGDSTALFMNQGGSGLTVKASAASVAVGQSVTLSSTFTATLSGQPVATGTITFYDGASSLGTTAVDGSLATAALAVGTHSVTAKYSGDGHFNPNTSAAVSVVVTAASTGSLTLSPATVAFGNTAVGATSAAQLITLKNTGTAAVKLTSTAMGGTNPGDFVKGSTNCPGTLAAGALCTLSMSFTPTAAGARSAVFSNYDTAAGSPHQVALTGTGVAAAALTMSPSTVTFGSTTIGATSAVQLVTLKNTGTVAVKLTSTAMGGTNPGDFLKASTNCPGTLAAGASCTVSMEFKPTVAGTRSAVFSNYDTAAGSPQTVTLTGTGVAAGAISMTPATLAFPSMAIGTSSAVQLVTLKNTGTTAVTLTSTSMGGTNPNDFLKASTNCPGSLAAGASCTVSMQFKPTAAGARSAVFYNYDTAAGSPHQVALSGTGK